jgi:lauroyl/myristoyl acyltransferase
MRKQQKPMIFEGNVSADPLERTVQLGNTAERLGAVAEEIEIISAMLKECRLSAQAKTLRSMAEPIQQIIEHLRNGKDLKALLEREKIRKTGTALMVAYLTKPEAETFKIKRA